MAGDGGGCGEAWAGLGLADVEEAHDAQQHHGGRVELQLAHLLHQGLVPVLVRRVAAPGTDEDVRVVHLSDNNLMILIITTYIMIVHLHVEVLS